MFNLALESDVLFYAPKIKLLDEHNTRSGFFERSQLTSVLRHLPPEIRPVIQFAATTGWRVADEVLPLEWRQVNFDTSEVTLDVHSTKNDEGRVFPMTTDLRALLQAQHVEHERLKKAGHICRTSSFAKSPRDEAARRNRDGSSASRRRGNRRA